MIIDLNVPDFGNCKICGSVLLMIKLESKVVSGGNLLCVCSLCDVVQVTKEKT